MYAFPAVVMSLALAILPRAANGADPVNIWYKLCTSAPLTQPSAELEAGDVCQTMADVRDNKSSVLVGRVTFRQAPGQSGYQLEAMLPLGSALPPGALVKIDDRAPIRLAFKRCDQVGCYARATVSSDVFMQMKAGKKIAYLGIDTAGRALSLPLPLTGFAEAVDGRPVALDKYRDDQKKIADVIARRLAETHKAPPAVAQPNTGTFANAGKNPVINSGWFKLCPQVVVQGEQAKPGEAKPEAKKATVCLTQVDVRDETTMILVGKIAVRQREDQNSWRLLVMLPLNVSLSEGASVVIDKAEPIKLAFNTCDGTACYAETEIPVSSLSTLRNGQEIAYAGKDEKGDLILVPLSLSGFAKALDGPPLPLETYNAEMKRIAEMIVVRESRRRKQRTR